jgi:uncharacterized peroxidase-related enzyme
MTYLPSLPGEAGVLEAFRAYPEKGAPMLQYHQVLMRGPSPLSAAQREMIAAFVSGLNACEFCHGVHTAIAEIFGVDKDTLAKLVADVDTAPVEESTKVLLRYVRKLTLTPSRITPSDAQAVLDAGWSEDALHDAACVCALFSFMNRFVDGLGIETGQDYMQGMAKYLAEFGYSDNGPVPAG